MKVKELKTLTECKVTVHSAALLLLLLSYVLFSPRASAVAATNVRVHLVSVLHSTFQFLQAAASPGECVSLQMQAVTVPFPLPVTAFSKGQPGCSPSIVSYLQRCGRTDRGERRRRLRDESAESM